MLKHLKLPAPCLNFYTLDGMRTYRADLHIHTVLSPCGSLEMSPRRIVDAAIEKCLDVIAITDHNSTHQCSEVVRMGTEKGLWVIGGAEVNTREEVHGIALFENLELLQQFQLYLDRWLPNIPNKPERFGYQVWVNAAEEILGEEHRLLWSALNQSLDEVIAMVASLGGIFFPAHIDRPVNGILRQLGFIPTDLPIQAVEVLRNDATMDELRLRYRIISNSDAHTPEQIGARTTCLKMEALNFNELRMALGGVNGRLAFVEGRC